jgi:hypothetical protein
MKFISLSVSNKFVSKEKSIPKETKKQSVKSVPLLGNMIQKGKPFLPKNILRKEI